ncbi:MAG: hypothetical protein K1X78_09185 [Verrucomicrobiaceae bacterium]|nr:hypothetical protein [Verrucomicrobiaceae bacterium]
MSRIIKALLLALTVCCASAEDAQWKTTLAAKLADARVNESSGLAISRRCPGIFWTLNDSGGGPFLFAIDEKGCTRARCEIKGAANFDWEDIASGPDEEGTPTLFIGDIGDNLLIRSELEVYQVAEPVLDSAASGEPAETQATLVRKLRAAYPDGRHNAESLLCHPRTGRLFVITKSETGQCGVYAFPVKLQTSACMNLEAVAQFRIPPLRRPGKRSIDNCMATGACFSPDATRLVVSTYSSIYEWRLDPAKPLADPLAQTPLRIVPPAMIQCEAVCFGPDGKSLWLTSEHVPTPLYRIEVEK